jgi:hypothetical protein
MKHIGFVAVGATALVFAIEGTASAQLGDGGAGTATSGGRSSSGQQSGPLAATKRLPVTGLPFEALVIAGLLAVALGLAMRGRAVSAKE